MRGFDEVVLFTEWRFLSLLLSVSVPWLRLSNVGEMNISAGTNRESPACAVVRHRRKEGLWGVAFSAFSLAFPL